MNLTHILEQKDIENELIRKGNQLIESKYKLTLHQQRILYDLLERITPFDEDFKEYRMDVDKIAKKYNIQKSKSIYREIHDALKGLVGYVLQIENDKDVLVVSWLSSAKYKKGEGYADVCFDPNLKPYLLQLKNHYTEYPAIAVSGFKSSYSFRFYEWLQTFRYKGNGGKFYRIFTVKEMRNKMNIADHEYKFFTDFKRRIIEPAMREIQLHSDLNIVSIEYIKVGRNIDQVKITAQPKKQKSLATTPERPLAPHASHAATPNPAPSNTAFIPVNQAFHTEVAPQQQKKNIPVLSARLQNIGIGQETANKWINKYGSERIERNLNYLESMQKGTQIKSPGAYLARAIMDDMAYNWQMELDNARKAKDALEDEKMRKAAADAILRKKEDEEHAQLLAIFNALDEMMQDVVLDFMAHEISKMGSVLTQIFQTQRAKKNAHMQPMFQFLFKKSMLDNGLYDADELI